jgi:hypothetical protein
MTATLFSSREFARGKPLLLFVGGRSSSEVLANLQGQRLLRFSCQQSEASSRIAPQKRAFRHLAEMSASQTTDKCLDGLLLSKVDYCRVDGVTSSYDNRR